MADMKSAGEPGFLASVWDLLRAEDKPTRDRILRWLADRSESDEREAQAKASGGAFTATHWSSGTQKESDHYWVVTADPQEDPAMEEAGLLDIVELDGWAIVERKYAVRVPVDDGSEVDYFATSDEAEAFVASMQEPEAPCT